MGSGGQRGAQGSGVVLVLLFTHLAYKLLQSRQNQRIPWATLALLALCFLVYADDYVTPIAVPLIPKLDQSLFCPADVLAALLSRGSHYWRRVLQPVVGSPFHHGDIMHLFFNMGSLMHNGSILEDYVGSSDYLLLVALSIPLLAAVNVVLSIATLMIVGYDEFTACGIGFSGVLFAMMMVARAFSERSAFYHGRQSFFGLFEVSNMQAIAVQTVMMTVLDPQVSFIAHASGVVVGALYLWKSGHWGVHVVQSQTTLRRPQHQQQLPNRGRVRYVIQNGRLRAY